MATIKNIIQTIFQSQGSTSTIRDLNNLGRAQTRLGQSSASAGRAFSSQAAGLGGLVAAYAGAAATTFALQQAFSKLAEAARAGQTLQGLTTLAATAAQDSERLLASVRNITKNQLTIIQAASQINLSLSAGFDTRQIEGLADVALRASRALGRDLTDAMTRVTRGSAKMETELLDELGIYTKIEPATRAYAASLNRTVGSLSEFERRQAFVNAVISEGQRKFSSINTVIPTSAETIEAFGVKMVDLATKLGILLADYVAPLADYLTNNLVASLSVVTLTFSLVAAKGASVLSAALTALVAKNTATAISSENVARSLLGLKTTVLAANNAIKSINVSTLSLTAAQQAELVALQTTAATRALSNAEMVKAIALINTNTAALTTQNAALQNDLATSTARKDALKQEMIDKRAAYNADRTNTAALREANVARGAYGAAVRANNALVAQSTPIINANSAALTANAAASAAATAATTGFLAKAAGTVSAVIKGVGTVFAVISAIALGFISFISIAAIVVGAIALITLGIAKLLGKDRELTAFFVNLGKIVKKGIFGDNDDTKKVIQGITAGALTDLEKVNSELRDLESFKFTSTLIGFSIDVEVTKEEAVKEVNNLLVDLADDTEVTFSSAISSGAAKGFAVIGGSIGGVFGPLGIIAGAAIGAGIGAALDAFVLNPAVDEDALVSIRNRYADVLADVDADTATTMASAILAIQNKYGDSARADPGARALILMQTELILASGKYLENIQAISEIMAATGQDAGQIVRNFDDFTRQVNGFEYLASAVSRLGDELLEFRFIDLNDEELKSTIDVVYTGLRDLSALDDFLAVDPANINALNGLFETAAKIANVEGKTYEDILNNFNTLSANIPQDVLSNIVIDSGTANIVEFIKTFNALGGSIEAVTNRGFNFREGFEQLGGTVNGATRNLLRTNEALRLINSGLSSNTLTLEQFSQSMSNASTGLLLVNQQIIQARTELAAVNDDLVAARRTNIDPASITALEDLRDQIIENIAVLDQNSASQRKFYDELKASESALRTQIELSEFLRESLGKQENAYARLLELELAGAEDPLAARLEYFQQFIEGTQSAGIAYESLRTNLAKPIGASNLELTSDQQAEILRSTASDVEGLVDRLKDLGVASSDVGAGIIEIAGESFQLLSADDLALALTYLNTVENILKLQFDSILAATALTREYEANALARTNEIKLATIKHTQLVEELALVTATAKETKALADLQISLNEDNARLNILKQQATLTAEVFSLENNRIQAAIELEQLSSERQIDALDAQIQRTQQLNDLAEERLALEDNIANRYIAKLTDMSDPQALMSAFSREATTGKSVEGSTGVASILAATEELFIAIEEQARAEYAATELAYTNRLDLIKREEEVARLNAQSDLAIIDLQIEASRNAEGRALNRIAEERAIIALSESIAKQETTIARDSLYADIARLDREKTFETNKYNNELSVLNLQDKIDRDRALSQVNNIELQLQTIKTQSESNKTFLTEYAKLLTYQARISTPDAAEITVDDASNTALDTLIASMGRIRAEINATYDVNLQRSTEIATIQADNASDAAAMERSNAAAALELLNTNAAEEIRIREQTNAAAIAAENAQYTAEVANTADLREQRIAAESAIRDIESKAEADREAAAISFSSKLLELEATRAGAINEYFTQVNSQLRQMTDEAGDAIRDIELQMRTIENEEVLLELRFNLDKSNLESELEEIAQRSAISIAQAQIGLLEAQQANEKISPVEATDRIIEERRKIFAAEIALEEIRYVRQRDNIIAELAIVEEEARQRQDGIRAATELALADIAAKNNFIIAQDTIYANATAALGSINQELVSGFTQVSNGLLQGLAKIFNGAAKAISTALGEASGGFVGVSATSIAAPNLGITEYVETANEATARLNQLTVATKEFSAAQIAASEAATDRERTRADAALVAADEVFVAQSAVNEITRQTAAEQEETARREAREGDGGGGGGEEAQKLLDELNKKFNDAVKTMVESIKDVFIQVITLISDTITTISQTKIEGLIAQEEMLTSILENTSDRLGDVQSELSDSLDKELELREKILEQTEALVDAQETYVKSIGLQNASIADSSALYIEKLVEQKQSILDLAVAGRKSIALKKQEASLIDTQAQQEAALESVTQARVKAEEQLALTQELLSFGSDLLSGKFTSLATAMMAAGQSINAVLQMLGLAGGAGVSLTMDAISGALSGTSNALKEFSTTLGKYLEEGGGATASGVQNALSAQQTSNLTGLSTALNAIGGAATGMQIGSVISGLVGDSGWATTIGGTIGGALATVFTTQIVSFIGSTAIGAALTASLTTALGTAAATTMLTAAFSVAIPVVGAIIGALIGSLFKKTPKASASGTITAEGVSDTQYSASGGASSEGARSLGSIAENTLGGIISSLEQAGIMFTSAIDYTIKTVRSSITAASLQMEDGKTFSARDLGQGQAGAVAAEAFFIESFYKGLRVGDLIVQQLIPGAKDIQTAIDYFARLRNEAEKTQERFEEGINFAISFRDTLRELDGPGFSTDELFTLITDSAKANAISLAAFYADLTNQTISVFGSNSSQFLDLQSSIRTSLLSQIGLAEQIVNGTSQLIPISQALEGIDSGAVLVRSIIDEVTALTAVFQEQATALAGINIEDAINLGINTQLREAVSGIGDSISDGIELLRNPAAAAVQGLESIILNGIERLKVTTGIFNELEASLSAGVAISYDIMAAAEEAMNNAPVLTDLEIDAYLRSLTEAQLQAVIAAGMLENAILDLAEAQLSALEAIGGQRAVKSLIALSKGFKDLIGDITSSFAGISFQDLIGIGPDVLSIADSLGQEGIVDDFVLSISNMLNELASGNNVVENFTDANNLLVKAYDAGTLSAEELAAGLTMSIEATQEFLSTLNSLADLYEDVISQIADSIDAARSGVISALENLRDVIVGSFEDLIEATSNILSIFDTTLGGLGRAGNKLFDLQDRALDSLTKASEAVSAFEKENALTGRTSAQVATELATVKSRIALLMSQPVDLSKFMEISQLTSQQRALGSEFSRLSKVESEYEELLASRSGAVEDLAFVESTILSLNDQLIDTRRKESEVIQATQDAAVEFIKKQEELIAITEMLADANFNLNQARVDEQSAIVKLQQALTKYNTSMNTLEENIAGILDSNFLSATIEAALENARNLYYTLSDSELAPILAAITTNTEAAVGQLINLASVLDSFFNPEAVTTPEMETDLPYSELVRARLTDRFTEFNQDLIKYLDTDGLSKFYGPGGVFESFRSSLYTNLLVDGFEVLTVAGGPLDNFSTILMLTGVAIQGLVDIGATFSISLKLAESNFGTLVTATGVMADTVSTASIALFYSGEQAYLAAMGIRSFSSSLVSVTTAGANGSESISIFSTNILLSTGKILSSSELLTGSLLVLSEKLVITSAVFSTTTSGTELARLGLISFNNSIVTLTSTGNTIANAITAIADRLPASLTAYVTPLHNLAQTLSTISLTQPTGIIITNINTQVTAISNAVLSINGVFAPLLALFGAPATTAVTDFRTALGILTTTLVAVNNTAGLNTIIRDYIATVTNSQPSITKLITDYGTLRTTIDGLIGTDGRINSVRSAISTIGNDLLAAWNALRVNINTSAAALVVTSTIAPGQTVGLAPKDSTNLSNVATNSTKFTYIKAVGAEGMGQAVFKAEGGYISGPGTSTSDSISAQLSDGEYVLKASTVRKLGVGLLNDLNSSGDISNIIASEGRFGDSIAAHINDSEAKLLKKLGGSGTRNPVTGMLEFFGGASSGASGYGGLFAKEEAKLLSDNYGTLFSTKDVEPQSKGSAIINNYAAYMEAKISSLLNPKNKKVDITSLAHAVGKDGYQKRFSLPSAEMFGNMLGNNYAATAEMLAARGIAQNTIGTSKNYIGTTKSLTPTSLVGRDDARLSTKLPDGLSNFEGIAESSLYWLSGLKESSTRMSTNNSSFKKVVDEQNRTNPYFFDFYMLKDAYNKVPIKVIASQEKLQKKKDKDKSSTSRFGIDYDSDGISDVFYSETKDKDGKVTSSKLTEATSLERYLGLASGGLVNQSGALHSLSNNKNPRDSIPAMLEPGEFVLRKPAVDRMGVDNAIRLNSTGSIDNDVSVEVNVINNSSPVTPTIQQTRRENGKIVVDVILEDIRNNGPIRQSLRGVK